MRRWTGLYMVGFIWGYFRKDRNALVFGSFQLSLSFSMLNLFDLWDGQNIEKFSRIGVSLVFSQITFGLRLVHVETMKLICKGNQLTGFCVILFFQKSLSKQTIILNACGSGKYTSVLYFSIRRGGVRVFASSWTQGVQGFLGRSLMYLVIK